MAQEPLHPADQLQGRVLMQDVGDDELLLVEVQDAATQICDKCLNNVEAVECNCYESKSQRVMLVLRDAAGATLGYALTGARDVALMTASGAANIAVNAGVGTVFGGVRGAATGAAIGAFWTTVGFVTYAAGAVARGAWSATSSIAHMVAGGKAHGDATLAGVSDKPSASMAPRLVDASVQVEMLSETGGLAAFHFGAPQLDVAPMEQSVAVVSHGVPASTETPSPHPHAHPHTQAHVSASGVSRRRGEGVSSTIAQVRHPVYPQPPRLTPTAPAVPFSQSAPQGLAPITPTAPLAYSAPPQGF
eukprot:m.18121 g.18121  ORF g.18121 m.18121 type:complete len:304 (+) comp7697_c0_seq1:240-1151(+)